MKLNLPMIDVFLEALLLVGAALHAYGTLTGYETGSEIWVWSLGSAMAAWLVAALNMMRRARPGDRFIAWHALAASVLWVLIVFCFGYAIGNLFDPRVLWHAVCAAGLALFSLKALNA